MAEIVAAIWGALFGATLAANAALLLRLRRTPPMTPVLDAHRGAWVLMRAKGIQGDLVGRLARCAPLLELETLDGRRMHVAVTAREVTLCVALPDQAAIQARWAANQTAAADAEGRH